jgi:hypothetical protein
LGLIVAADFFPVEAWTRRGLQPLIEQHFSMKSPTNSAEDQNLLVDLRQVPRNNQTQRAIHSRSPSLEEKLIIAAAETGQSADRQNR